MKTINQYISEKLKITKKNTKNNIVIVNTLEDLKKEIKTRIISDNNEELDLSNISLSENITSLDLLFANNMKIKKIDVTGWDVSSVKSMSEMFYTCTSLEEVIGLDTWDTSSCESFRRMFYDCNNLTMCDVERWNIESLKDCGYMFKNCNKLALDLTSWNLSKVKHIQMNRNSNISISEE